MDTEILSFMNPIKFGIQLPLHYDRRLRLWAKVKGTARATLAANIVQARIEANWTEVERQLDEIAARQGMTREQLEAQLLNGNEDDD